MENVSGDLNLQFSENIDESFNVIVCIRWGGFVFYCFSIKSVN